MKRFTDWLDDRTGYRDFIQEALFESIPGGARWRYVWGSTLVFTFTVQVITGVFLWMCYSPSAQTAWESVYYIQYEMQGGWLLRGVHHYTAQAMIVLLVLHLMQVVVDGAYRAPREVNFWLGLILMQIVLGLSLTGYLLPWDQKGFWATKVATELLGLVPVVGHHLQPLVLGGAEYGHHTLTRFFALHAGVLPGLLIFFLVLHVYMFRRHGICHKLPVKQPESMFWPDQLLKDAVACLAVLAVVLLLVVRSGFDSNYHFSAEHAGAELGAPADASEPYSAARPEWYFLFLFQLLKAFPGEQEVYGAIVLPGVVMALLFAMPLVGRWKLGHMFNIGLLFVLIFGGVLPLTYQAWRADYRDDTAKSYLEAVEEANVDAERARQLAKTGIPSSGAIALMRQDAKTQGRRLFASKGCASCHDQPLEKKQAKELALDGAPNLNGFATRKWLAGLLDPKQIAGPDYFGNTKKHSAGEMVGFVQGEMQKMNKEQVQNVILALSAEAQLKSQRKEDERDREKIAAGFKLLQSEDGCGQCHRFHNNVGLGTAPDLTGYATRQWIIDFIANPAAERFYGHENERMPIFADQLTPESIALLADYLRQDWHEPAATEEEAEGEVAAADSLDRKDREH